MLQLWLYANTLDIKATFEDLFTLVAIVFDTLYDYNELFLKDFILSCELWNMISKSSQYFYHMWTAVLKFKMLIKCSNLIASLNIQM